MPFTGYYLRNSLIVSVSAKGQLWASQTSPLRLQKLTFRVAKPHLLEAHSACMGKL